jgi:hypothetical protein
MAARLLSEQLLARLRTAYAECIQMLTIVYCTPALLSSKAFLAKALT